jgi:hypothetical protein
MASTSGEWWMKQELKVGCLAGTPIRGEGGNDGDWRGAKEGDEEDSVQISGGLKQPLVEPEAPSGVTSREGGGGGVGSGA